MQANHQRADTRFSDDGRAVFVRLQVSREDYEFARSWAEFHSDADPAGTAEDHLEGTLNTALLSHRQELGWEPSEAIKAFCETASDERSKSSQTRCELPF
jgi:hypothetical protein